MKEFERTSSGINRFETYSRENHEILLLFPFLAVTYVLLQRLPYSRAYEISVYTVNIVDFW